MATVFSQKCNASAHQIHFDYNLQMWDAFFKCSTERVSKWECEESKRDWIERNVQKKRRRCETRRDETKRDLEN